MLGKTHGAAGVLSGLLLANYVFKDIHIVQTIGIVAVTTAGSLFPDIDHGNSTLTNRFPQISHYFSRYLTSCTVGFGDAKYTQSLISHRGYAHSIFMLISLFIYLLPVLFFGLDYFLIWVFLSVGIISHLLLDVVTIDGIRLFAPFSNKKFSLTYIRTGGIEEIIIRLLIITGIIYVIYKIFVGAIY